MRLKKGMHRSRSVTITGLSFWTVASYKDIIQLTAVMKQCLRHRSQQGKLWIHTVGLDPNSTTCQLRNLDKQLSGVSRVLFDERLEARITDARWAFHTLRGPFFNSAIGLSKGF